MKKTAFITTAIATCMTAAIFAGCSGNTEVSHETAAASLIAGGQATVASEQQTTGAVTAANYAYAINYNGYKIGVGMTADEAIKILGDNYEFDAQANCAGQGFANRYTYDGFALFAQEKNGTEVVVQIDITGNLVDCSGIYVGDTLTKAKEVFGAPTEDYEVTISYTSGAEKMDVFAEGDKIVEIVINAVE